MPCSRPLSPPPVRPCLPAAPPSRLYCEPLSSPSPASLLLTRHSSPWPRGRGLPPWSHPASPREMSGPIWLVYHPGCKLFDLLNPWMFPKSCCHPQPFYLSKPKFRYRTHCIPLSFHLSVLLCSFHLTQDDPRYPSCFPHQFASAALSPFLRRPRLRDPSLPYSLAMTLSLSHLSVPHPSATPNLGFVPCQFFPPILLGVWDLLENTPDLVGWHPLRFVSPASVGSSVLLSPPLATPLRHPLPPSLTTPPLTGLLPHHLRLPFSCLPASQRKRKPSTCPTSPCGFLCVSAHPCTPPVTVISLIHITGFLRPLSKVLFWLSLIFIETHPQS